MVKTVIFITLILTAQKGAEGHILPTAPKLF